MELEEEFDINIPDDAAEKIQTVGQAVEYIEKPSDNLDRVRMKRRVVVTGLGAVTSLSLKVEDLWQRILRGESGIHALQLFDTTQYKVHFGGDIYDWSPGEYISAKDDKRLDRFTQFALVAGIDAVRDSGLDFSKEDPFRCGVILGSGIGGLHEIETQHVAAVCTRARTRSRPSRFPS